MKKILLMAATAFASMAMLAQTAEPTAYQIDGNSDFKGVKFDYLYKWWDAKKKNTTPKCKLMKLDFTTNALVPVAGGSGDGIGDGTVKNGGGMNAGKWYVSSPYAIKWNETIKAMQIDAKIDPANDNWTEVSLSWLDNIQQEGMTDWADYDPFTQASDSAVGPMIDMTDKDARMATVTYRIDNGSLCDTVNMRMDLGDANGRVSNGYTPHHPLSKETEWKTQDFIWGADELGTGNNYDVTMMHDAYVEGFFNTKNGRKKDDDGAYILAASMFALYGDSAALKGTGAGYNMEIDESKISKVVMGFNDGKRSTEDAGCTSEFTIYIQKILIGSPSVTAGDAEFVDLASLATSSKFVAGKAQVSVTPNVGRNFKFQGNGVMVDVLGKQVAQGVDGISAKAIGAGVYYIIVDGVASRVIVK